MCKGKHSSLGYLKAWSPLRQLPGSMSRLLMALFINFFLLLWGEQVGDSGPFEVPGFVIPPSFTQKLGLVSKPALDHRLDSAPPRGSPEKRKPCSLGPAVGGAKAAPSATARAFSALEGATLRPAAAEFPPRPPSLLPRRPRLYTAPCHLRRMPVRGLCCHTADCERAKAGEWGGLRVPRHCGAGPR